MPTQTSREIVRFFLYPGASIARLKHATGMFLDAATILCLHRKIRNANTEPQPKGWGFFLPETAHRHVSKRRDNPLFTRDLPR